MGKWSHFSDFQGRHYQWSWFPYKVIDPNLGMVYVKFSIKGGLLKCDLDEISVPDNRRNEIRANSFKYVLKNMDKAIFISVWGDYCKINKKHTIVLNI